MTSHALVLACGAIFSALPAWAGAPPVTGIEAEWIAPGIRPQDDFFRYVNGRWLDTTPIPAEQSRWSTFEQLDDAMLPQLRGVIEAAGADPHAAQVRALYASFMDEAGVEALGARPLAGELARIRAMHDHSAIPALVAHLNEIGAPALLRLRVAQDERDSSRRALLIEQAGLGMPDRDYFLEPDFASARVRYRAHVAASLARLDVPEATVMAGRIVDFETALARLTWTQVASRDRIKRYNKVPLADIATVMPGYNLRATLADAGMLGGVDAVIVVQPSYLAGLAALLESTDIATVRAYFAWQLVHAYARYLSEPFVKEDFAFRATLNGAAALAPRWKRGVEAVDGALGEALGRLYVARYLAPERKAQMQHMVDNLLQAYHDSIDKLDWMGPETKREAQAKLAAMRIKIGYPDAWRDDSALTIRPDDLVGNMLRAAHFTFRRQAERLGHPVDRADWLLTPQRVDADYNPMNNDITFPAGILQPPFFQADADDAVNYGAIGSMIGHEISHGFDNKGSQSDGAGNLRDWWTPQDRQRFAQKAAMLVRQYDDYSPVPGYQVNGTLTLPENIADNAGLAVAYRAYHRALGGQPAPVIGGLTGDQRFYMSFARVWRGKTRAARQVALIKTETHAPSEFRTNGTLRNQLGFIAAFGVAPGDGMYLAPEDRFTMW